jgi:hypothetical protein
LTMVKMAFASCSSICNVNLVFISVAYFTCGLDYATSHSTSLLDCNNCACFLYLHLFLFPKAQTSSVNVFVLHKFFIPVQTYLQFLCISDQCFIRMEHESMCGDGCGSAADMVNLGWCIWTSITMEALDSCFWRSASYAP